MLMQLNDFFLLLHALNIGNKIYALTDVLQHSFSYVKDLKPLKRKYFITNFNAFKIILYHLNL